MRRGSEAMMRMLCLMALSIALLGSSCESEDKVKMSEIEETIHEGIDRRSVEQFFQDHDIDYTFVPRAQADNEVPKFDWKNPEALGIYAGVVRDVRARWWMLASEHISIEVEIGPDDTVSQVVLQRAYTAP